jgi:REase_DpnII-MboI
MTGLIPRVATDALLSLPLATVDDAIRKGGLEGHLAVLVLRTSRADVAGPVGESRWLGHLRDLLADDPIPAGCPLRTQDVATIGARLALGGDPHRAAGYALLAAHELAREPLSPAVRVHEDERLLIGLAAGVGVAASTVAPTLISVLRRREHINTYRGLCLDLWAEGLALGSARLTPTLADRAMRILSGPPGERPPVTDDDRLALYWLATRLLEAVWRPTDQELAALESVIVEGRRAALTVTSAHALPPLDAAMVLDALTWSPPASLARRAALEYVLDVIDTFPTAASILATRARNRAPFMISDEYDVQDLFHALVYPGVPDIVPEDTTPKLAGKWSRLDFTSKATRLGFEIKHLKTAGHAATVREELLIDEATYQEHPYLDTVVAFISDPHSYIPYASRPAFESDLSKSITVSGRTVHYVVRVRG